MKARAALRKVHALLESVSVHVCGEQVVKLWREDLAGINAKAAESLADPAQYPNLFPNLDLALHAEQYQVACLAFSLSRPVRMACTALCSSGAFRFLSVSEQERIHTCSGGGTCGDTMHRCTTLRLLCRLGSAQMQMRVSHLTEI